jgi:beta-phosphoglucomutase-like phosphatase (HAD superfamily)
VAIRAVIFDLDGVLVDACEWHYNSLNDALETVAGFTINYDDHMLTFNGLPTYKKLDILVDQGRLDQRLRSRVADLKQELTMNIIRGSAREDLVKKEIHRRLRDLGIKIGCVTNCKRESAEAMLEATGQDAIIPYLICNEDIANPKPHPEGFITMMVLLQSFPKETVIFEDSDKGLAAAYATGARVIRVLNSSYLDWQLVSRAIA